MFGLGIVGIGIYLYTIYDVVESHFASKNDRIIWLLIVLLIPFFGTILWFLVGKKKSIT